MACAFLMVCACKLLELLGLREFEGQCQRCEDLHMRPALLAGEDGLVDLLCDGRIGCQ